MRKRADATKDLAQRTLLWKVWERMLEIEFVDRSVALAGKAFVSFFPLVIVIAAFVPASIRNSIFTTLSHQFGLRGDALAEAKGAFASADNVRRATGLLGLVLTLFFASSFTTAIQRVYLRAWRREPGGKAAKYTRGPAWLVVIVAYMALVGALRSALGDGPGLLIVGVAAIAMGVGIWWFSAWFLLLGHVRPRVLLPTGVITGLAMFGYVVSASVWMPNVVTRNQSQFGFFGVALAMVTWFTGASVCIIVGACAGPALAEDRGRVGTFIRGGNDDLLVEGATPSLPGPTETLSMRDAFRTEREEPRPTDRTEP